MLVCEVWGNFLLSHRHEVVRKGQRRLCDNSASQGHAFLIGRILELLNPCSAWWQGGHCGAQGSLEGRSPLKKGMLVLKPCFWGREDIVALKHRLEGRVGAPKAPAPAAAPPALEAKAGQEGSVAASDAVAGPQTSDAVEKDPDSFEVAVVRDDEEAGSDDLPRCRPCHAPIYPFPSLTVAGQRCGRRQGQ